MNEDLLISNIVSYNWDYDNIEAAMVAEETEEAETIEEYAKKTPPLYFGGFQTEQVHVTTKETIDPIYFADIIDDEEDAHKPYEHYVSMSNNKDFEKSIIKEPTFIEKLSELVIESRHIVGINIENAEEIFSRDFGMTTKWSIEDNKVIVTIPTQTLTFG